MATKKICNKLNCKRRLVSEWLGMDQVISNGNDYCDVDDDNDDGENGDDDDDDDDDDNDDDCDN